MGGEFVCQTPRTEKSWVEKSLTFLPVGMCYVFRRFMDLREKLRRLSPGGCLGGVWWFLLSDQWMVFSVRPLEEWSLLFAFNFLAVSVFNNKFWFPGGVLLPPFLMGTNFFCCEYP
jgi:hypothetical protein